MPKEELHGDSKYITAVIVEINRFLSYKEKAAINRQLYRLIIQNPTDEYRVCIRTTAGATQYRPIRKIPHSTDYYKVDRSLIVDTRDDV